MIAITTTVASSRPHNHVALLHHDHTTTLLCFIMTTQPHCFASSQPLAFCFCFITKLIATTQQSTMKLTCAARHLCALPNVPIPIKLPGDKTDTSPSAPDEPKHICEHCRKPMHGGICGQNFRDVHDTLDKTKLHHKDTNEINPIATICLPCYHDLLLTKIITSPALFGRWH